MKFVDEAIITVRSGRGGKGCVSFMRQAYMPRMGPDGGNGGRGGHVIFRATRNKHSLLDFRFQSRYAAEDGAGGQGFDKDGRSGKDLLIEVPSGTVLKNAETGAILADLAEDEQEIVLLKGGRGGMGNKFFTSSTRQAPDYAQPGEDGNELQVKLELKLLADVAIVGFPNAGKSTLISRWSGSKAKIGDYPFTTLTPNLGVVRGHSRDFILADIPGLIEKAHEGRGLGQKFLKHSERSRILLVLLDADPHSPHSPPEQYQILQNELNKFSAAFSQKAQIVAMNKLDAFGSKNEAEWQKLCQELAECEVEDVHSISAVSGMGLDQLKKAIEDQLDHDNATKSASPESLSEEQSLVLGDEELFDGSEGNSEQ